MVIFKNSNNLKVFILASLFGILAAGCSQPSIASLIKDLGSKQPTVRQAAYKVLIEKGKPVSAPLIRAIRANNDYTTKTNAIKILGELGETRAIDTLINSLNNSDYRIVEQAEIALVEIGKPGVPRLVETLQKDKRFFLRFEAAKILGHVRDKRAMKPLIAALGDNDSLVREGACAALIDLGGEKPALFLINALKGRREGFQDEKATAWTTNKRMIKLLDRLLAKDTNGWVKHKTVKSLGDMHSSGVVLLTKTLLQEDDDRDWYEEWDEHWGNKEDLRQIGKLSVAPLLEILNSRVSPSTKVNVANLLGSIRDKRAAQPLIGLLRNRDSRVCAFAARTLGELKAKSAVEPLLSTLNNANLYHRDAVIEALGRIGDKRAAKPLIELLKHQDGWTRLNAVAALGEIGDARAVEPLINVFEHDDYSNKGRDDIKTEAAGAIGKIGGVKAIDFLIAKANGPATAAVKSSGNSVPVIENGNIIGFRLDDGVIGGLAKTKSRRAVEMLMKLRKSKDRDIKWLSVYALSEIKTGQVMEVMASEADNPDPEMRMIAVGALGMSKNKAALKPLKKALKDKNSDVRQIAVEGIRRAAGDQTVVPLIAMLRDRNEYVKAAAAQGLGYSRDQRAFGPLLKVAKQEQKTRVKRAAIFALGKLGDRRAILTLAKIAHNTRGSLQYQAQVALIRLGVIYGRPVDWTLRN